MKKSRFNRVLDSLEYFIDFKWLKIKEDTTKALIKILILILKYYIALLIISYIILTIIDFINNE